ncbi:hypothetical protein KP509_1Z112600 [Ceratopteris richardii]|nr:hypothetical protein KP509_1Z112600 [Ceratopteris richardii]
MAAYFLQGDCSSSVRFAYSARPLDERIRIRQKVVNLPKIESRCEASIFICSNSGQFRLSKWRHVLRTRAAANGNAGDPQEDAGDFYNVEAEQKNEGGNNARISFPEIFTSAKNALASGTDSYMHIFREEVRQEAGHELEMIQKGYNACLKYVDRKGRELKPFVTTLKGQTTGLIMQTKKLCDILMHRIWPQFVSWNRLDLWKDVKRWDVQRYGALILYALLAASCLRVIHIFFIQPRRMEELTQAYMESIIPDPSPHNVKKLRKALWRKSNPKGLRMQRYIYGSNGDLVHDLSFVGENPWDESEDEIVSPNMNELIDQNPNLTEEQRKELKDMAAETAEVEMKRQEARSKMTWEQRLIEWDKMLKLEDLKDQIMAMNSNFIVGVDLDDIKGRLKRKDNEQTNMKPPIGILVSKRWWAYRPKLPYMYFLSKLQRFEVQSAVYTSDTKRLYVQMKEGFPKEYTVDVPVDPLLHDLMKNYGVEIDIAGRSQWSYYARAFIVLAPSVLLLLQVKHFSDRAMEMTSEKILDLLKMDREHLILPEDAAQKAKSEYRDVIVGDKIWKVLEEIMCYMREPMRYLDKGILLPRVSSPSIYIV